MMSTLQLLEGTQCCPLHPAPYHNIYTSSLIPFRQWDAVTDDSSLSYDRYTCTFAHVLWWCFGLVDVLLFLALPFERRSHFVRVGKGHTASLSALTHCFNYSHSPSTHDRSEQVLRFVTVFFSGTRTNCVTNMSIYYFTIYFNWSTHSKSACCIECF